MTAGTAPLEGAGIGRTAGDGYDTVGTRVAAEGTGGIPIGVPVLAARWSDAVVAAGDHDVCPEDVALLLGRMAERLAGALTAEPFSPVAGREVGAELVGSRLTGPATIGVSVAVLSDLPRAVAGRPGADPDLAAARLPGLLGDLVTGYAAALSACTMEQLERRQGTGRRGELQREAQERMRAVFAGIDTALAICTPEGRIVETNPAFVEMLRHRITYLHTHTVFDLVHDEDAAMLRRVVDHDLVAGGHRRVRTEVRLRRRSGAVIPVKLTLSLVSGHDGRPAYLLVAGGGPVRPAGERRRADPRPETRRARIDLTRPGLFLDDRRR